MPDEEIKGLLRRSIELGEENNRMLKAVRRRSLYGTVFTILLWLIFVIIPAAVFYLYAAPYIDGIQAMMKSTQEMQAQFKGNDPTAFFQNLYAEYMNSKTK